MLPNGEQVAVKVQHLNLERMALVDSEGIGVLVRWIKWIFPYLDYTWLANEFKENITKELDFVNEAQHAETLAAYFGTSSLVKVPKIYWLYTTKKILTMEYIGDGAKITDLNYIKSYGLNINQIMMMLTKLFSEMVFTYGYLHCDPHPGNVWIRKLPKKNSLGHDFEIILLDHGLYIQLDPEFRYRYSQLWTSILELNEPKIRLCSYALGAGKLYRLFACMLTARSWEGLKYRTERSEEEMLQIRQGFPEHFLEINEILRNVPRELLMLFKTNDLLRHINDMLNAQSLLIHYSLISRYCHRTIRDYRLHHTSKRKL
jgi:aarF domain-containing kinase